MIPVWLVLCVVVGLIVCVVETESVDPVSAVVCVVRPTDTGADAVVPNDEDDATSGIVGLFKI